MATTDRHPQQRMLGELRCLVDQLWQAEPIAAPSTRSRLLEQLARIDHEIERLSLRAGHGEPVDVGRVRTCAARVDELAWWWRSADADRASA